MSKICRSYSRLADVARQKALLTTMISTLDWDQETFLPNKAQSYRAKQLAWLTSRRHELSTNPEIEKWLHDAQSENDEQAANLREWKNEWNRASVLPTALVEEESLICSESKANWVKARKNSDFNEFLPSLEKLIQINRKKAELWTTTQTEPYDSLLDFHERGANAQQISTLFQELAPALSSLSQKASQYSKLHKDLFPFDAVYPQAQQANFNTTIATAIGFDFQAGRIDPTNHPFCTTLGPWDIRLTTRYLQNDFRSSLFSVLHEAGHGLYELGLPKEQFGLPAAEAASLGFHESQSRLWENHVGRSPEFWNKFYPQAQQTFPALRSLSIDDFLDSLHRSSPSFIRVEADELTYDLHIILRFELERAMINGDLSPKDLPEAWNSRFYELFGLKVPDNANGCLQDIHWAMGAFGYFPTYTIGNITAANLIETAKLNPEISSAFSDGNFSPLLAWLRKNVHSQGAIYLPSELIKKITGHQLEIAPYLRYLTSRYIH